MKALLRAFLFSATMFGWRDDSRVGLPEGGNGVGEFVLENFDEFFAFRLTIGPTLYKYMRMYLWTDVWQ